MRPAPGEWSPVEIICHLRDEEVEDFGARLQVIVSGAGDFTPIEPERWAEERRYREASLRSQYRFMELAREKAQAGPPLPGTGGTYHVRPAPPARSGAGPTPGATAAPPPASS